MELEGWIMIAEKLGLPALMLGFFAYYVKYLQQEMGKEREEMRKSQDQNEQQLIDLVKTSSDALVELKTALSDQTITMRELLANIRRK